MAARFLWRVGASASQSFARQLSTRGCLSRPSPTIPSCSGGLSLDSRRRLFADHRRLDLRMMTSPQMVGWRMASGSTKSKAPKASKSAGNGTTSKAKASKVKEAAAAAAAATDSQAEVLRGEASSAATPTESAPSSEETVAESPAVAPEAPPPTPPKTAKARRASAKSPPPSVTPEAPPQPEIAKAPPPETAKAPPPPQPETAKVSPPPPPPPPPTTPARAMDPSESVIETLYREQTSQSSAPAARGYRFVRDYVLYLAATVLGVGIVGYVCYELWTAIVRPTPDVAVFEQAMAILRKDAASRDLLGRRVVAVSGRRRGRPRQLDHSFSDAKKEGFGDGHRVDVAFFVRGDENRAVAHAVGVLPPEAKRWTLCYLELKTHEPTPSRAILFDARTPNEPPTLI